ncbi:MAG TPA: tetratricopeptide repeat protein [Pirellulales bacterium]|nr:tetratricopeptide repeat protein [Pirellulales bacterium]
MSTANPMPEEPATLDALAARAHQELGAGRLPEAEATYRQILALWPGIAEAHGNLGIVLWHQRKFEEALAQFEQAVVLEPDLADAHNNLGNALGGLGRLDEAASQYEQAVALKPDYAEAHNNLANILREQGKLEEAMVRYQQALALRPDYADAHNNLGNAWRALGRFEEAAGCFEQALALRPNFAEAHYNLGLVLWQQDQLAEAVARFQQAVALKPDFAEAQNNLGVALREQLKLAEARQAFERLLTIQPDSPSAQLGLAICSLVEGDFERGWPAFEARLRMSGAGPLPNLPRWAGEPLAGRSLLLVAEQGLGDTLQFVRYVRLLKERGARVVLACQRALGRLLESQGDWDELFVLGSAEEWPRCDFYLPLLSAPAAFHTGTSTIPRKVPYLAADAALVAKWRRELAAVAGFKIGIAWQGSQEFSSDRRRSIPLAQFAPLARLPGVRLISLQKGFGSEQVAAVDFPVLDLSERLDEASGALMDTAAVIRNLDLVVAPDTAIAHLAGALGAPVGLALQFSPNWRWLLGRDDSPWYPTMRLFRQTTPGEWSDVFGRITQAVRGLSSRDSGIID